MRRMGLFFVLGLVFVRFSMVNDLLTYVLHANLFLLYLCSVPALIGFFASGGLRRALQHKAVLLWCGFVIWMFVCVPFSVWKGASLISLGFYVRTVLPILFLCAGLAMTWAEVRWMVYAVVIAGAFNASASSIFMREVGVGRASVSFTGTIGNPNDIAAHLLFLLPYFVFWALAARVPFVVRLLGWPAMGLALYWILGSGSRGALLALAVGMVLLLVRFTLTQSIAAVSAGFVLALVALPMIPESAINRAVSVFTDSKRTVSEIQEADESSQVRKRLLRKSIEFSIRHPLFGVGPFQFGNADGMESASDSGKRIGERSLWFPAHNSFLTVSAESGVIGFVCFLGALLVVYRNVRRAAKVTRQWPQLHEITTALTCFEISLVSFSVAIFFTNFTYYFHLPAIVGMGAVLARAALQEAAALAAAAPAVTPGAPAGVASRAPAPGPKPPRFLPPRLKR